MGRTEHAHLRQRDYYQHRVEDIRLRAMKQFLVHLGPLGPQCHCVRWDLRRPEQGDHSIWAEARWATIRRVKADSDLYKLFASYIYDEESVWSSCQQCKGRIWRQLRRMKQEWEATDPGLSASEPSLPSCDGVGKARSADLLLFRASRRSAWVRENRLKIPTYRLI